MTSHKRYNYHLLNPPHSDEEFVLLPTISTDYKFNKRLQRTENRIHLPVNDAGQNSLPLFINKPINYDDPYLLTYNVSPSASLDYIRTLPRILDGECYPSTPHLRVMNNPTLPMSPQILNGIAKSMNNCGKGLKTPYVFPLEKNNRNIVRAKE